MKWRIEHNDKIQIEFYAPKIPYRETITKYAQADYRHKKQSGGAGQFGEVHMVIEPYEEGMLSRRLIDRWWWTARCRSKEKKNMICRGEVNWCFTTVL